MSQSPGVSLFAILSELGRSDVPHSSDDLMALLPTASHDKMPEIFSGPCALPVPPQKARNRSPALRKGASGPIWDVSIHPARLQLGRSRALSPAAQTSGTAANPGGLARQQAMLIALWTVDLVCIYANWGLISSSPRWVSSGLSLPPALPGLKASLANGPNARADGGLGRQGRSMALTAEESSRDLSVLMGNGDRGVVFLLLSQSQGLPWAFSSQGQDS